MSDLPEKLEHLARQDWAVRYEHDTLLWKAAEALRREEFDCQTLMDVLKTRETRLTEAETDRDNAIKTMLAMREQRERYATQVCLLLDAMREAGVHINEKWCWCGPTIESHAESGENK